MDWLPKRCARIFNPKLNNDIDDLLKLIEKEEDIQQQFNEDLIVHEAIWDIMQSIDTAIFDCEKIILKKTSTNFKSMEPIQRRFYNEYTKGKSKIGIFHETNATLVGCLSDIFDKINSDASRL